MRREICAALGAAALLCAPGKALADAGGQIAAVDAGAIVTFNADGTGYHKLYSTTSAFVREPVWSPDGNRLAFVDSGRIEVLDPATGVATAITAGDNGNPDSDPGWRPDGERIDFRRGSALLTVPAAGGAEQTLGQLPDAFTASLAWGPGGAYARVTTSGLLAVDLHDGGGEHVLTDGISGRPAWSPDGDSLAFSNGRLWITDFSDVWPADATAGLGSESDPAFSPDGTKLLHAYFNSYATVPRGLRLLDLDTGTGTGVPQPAGAGTLTQPAWQPCVTAETTSCTSVTPVPAARAICPATAALTVVAGGSDRVPLSCSPPIGRYEVVSAPAHGVLKQVGTMLYYFSTGGYSGPDSFVVRAYTFTGDVAVVTGTVTVLPLRRLVRRSPAPKVTLVGTAKLDRHGRAVVTLRCDQACSLTMRVTARLNTGRVVKGKLVKASAAAGATVKVTLRSGTVPKHRRIVAVHLVGTATGAAAARSFSLTVKR